MTAVDRPKGPGRRRKRAWATATAVDRIDQAIDASLVDVQKTITTMVSNAVRYDRCDHMALYLLQLLVGRVQALARQRSQLGQIDV